MATATTCTMLPPLLEPLALVLRPPLEPLLLVVSVLLFVLGPLLVVLEPLRVVGPLHSHCQRYQPY